MSSTNQIDRTLRIATDVADLRRTVRVVSHLAPPPDLLDLHQRAVANARASMLRDSNSFDFAAVVARASTRLEALPELRNGFEVGARRRDLLSRRLSERVAHPTLPRPHEVRSIRRVVTRASTSMRHLLEASLPVHEFHFQTAFRQVARQHSWAATSAAFEAIKATHYAELEAHAQTLAVSALAGFDGMPAARLSLTTRGPQGPAVATARAAIDRLFGQMAPNPFGGFDRVQSLAQQPGVKLPAVPVELFGHPDIYERIRAIARLPRPFDMLFGLLRSGLSDRSPLVVVVAALGRPTAVRLMLRERDHGVDAALDELAPGLASGRAVGFLEGAVEGAPHLTGPTRHWLRLGLDAVRRLDWVGAVPYLVPGLEGAFRDAARARGVTRFHSKREYAVTDGRRSAVDTANDVIRHLALGGQLETFLREKVYSHSVHQYRHAVIHEGNSEEEHFRRTVVLFILGLGVWLDAYADAPAVRTLAEHIEMDLAA